MQTPSQQSLKTQLVKIASLHSVMCMAFFVSCLSVTASALARRCLLLIAITSVSQKLFMAFVFSFCFCLGRRARWKVSERRRCRGVRRSPRCLHGSEHVISVRETGLEARSAQTQSPLFGSSNELGLVPTSSHGQAELSGLVLDDGIGCDPGSRTGEWEQCSWLHHRLCYLGYSC